jgi:uncharacterized protein (DUF58 family)
VHGRRRVGQGEAFWQFRRYEPGDTISRIDWRQSAKRDHVFVRETEWEAAQTVWLWRDTSASMNYRSANELPLKSDRADLVALALMALLMRAGERVGMIGTGLPPATGRAALNRFAEIMGRRQTGQGVPVGTPLPRHAQVVLIGDFLSPLPEIDAAVRTIAGRGIKGFILHVLDPAEESLPFSGRTRFEGLESDGHALIPRVESVRPEYHQLVANHIAGLGDIARAVGWGLLAHRTHHAPESALLALFLALSRSEDRRR